jgi:hypothetical protein
VKTTSLSWQIACSSLLCATLSPFIRVFLQHTSGHINTTASAVAVSAGTSTMASLLNPIKALVEKATSDDENPTPGYLFNEINRMSLLCWLL